MKPCVPPRERDFATFLGELAAGGKSNYTRHVAPPEEVAQSLAIADSSKAMVPAVASDFLTFSFKNPYH